jgi:uncharacterized protein
MLAITPVVSVEPTSDERTMAVLSHALQMVGGWIAPLVIFFVKRESRFVSFHALQALLLQIAHVVFIMIFMALWFGLVFSQMFLGENHSAPPVAIMIVFPLIWLTWMAVWVGTLIIAILYSIKAGRGEWAEYPVFGKIARRILKIGPGGMVLEP